jgi:SAM-dependent MidA family methyltransferase
MRTRAEPTPLAALLAEEIGKLGPMTFVDYMGACLYHPQYGYYSKSDQQPRRDYVTSVDVSPLFGRFLARQFHEMWDALGNPSRFLLVEAGAGAGALAKNILDFAADSFPEFYSALTYVAVERSEARRAAHASLLESHISHMGRAGFESSADLPKEISAGCIYSNELLDAFPVHRVVLQGDELREIYVAFDDERGLHERLGPLSSPRIAEYFVEQGIALQENQQAEVNLKACDWIEDAGRRLERGFLLTIDYGHPAAELYDERHMRGTLLAYQRHRASEDYFRAPGEQDLTALVNFTALDLWGRRSGLVRTGLTSQTNFLLSVARHSNCADLEPAGLSDAEQARIRLLFKTLIYPEGMGETFQVFAQHKGIEAPRLAGFEQF